MNSLEEMISKFRADGYSDKQIVDVINKLVQESKLSDMQASLMINFVYSTSENKNKEDLEKKSLMDEQDTLFDNDEKNFNETEDYDLDFNEKCLPIDDVLSYISYDKDLWEKELAYYCRVSNFNEIEEILRTDDSLIELKIKNFALKARLMRIDNLINEYKEMVDVSEVSSFSEDINLVINEKSKWINNDIFISLYKTFENEKNFSTSVLIKAINDLKEKDIIDEKQECILLKALKDSEK